MVVATTKSASRNVSRSKVDQQKKQQQQLDQILSANKKKKYCMMLALSPNFDERIQQELEAYLKNTYDGQCTLYVINDRTAFLKHFNKNVRLLIMDDNFDELNNVMKMVKALKQKQFDEAVPTLFFTTKPQDLIQTYRNTLAAYHEVDDLCVYNTMRLDEIIEKINYAVLQQNRRRSRRYSVDINVSFSAISNDKLYEAKFVDLSIHGALLKFKDYDSFKVGDQLKINIPVFKYIESDHDDILKLSAKIRRLHISGDRVAVSFEHISETQLLRLTNFVTAHAISQYGKNKEW